MPFLLEHGYLLDVSVREGKFGVFRSKGRLVARATLVLHPASIGNTVFLMKTMTVKLPEELAVRLEKRAKRLGVSKSALLRESLERELRNDLVVEEGPSMYDLVKGDLGCFDSGLGDLSTHPRHLKGFGRPVFQGKGKSVAVCGKKGS